ncbi:hypothetical protein PVAND_000477 [Polypedilum vanderplanki]|uniref:Ubiquitin-like protein 7 n=1 Tax=Polypedilum vanderplanki TaxID=319348 RepID=A0A9J6BKQ9_POLVA|nr:hypothetical protein PVAND_000477 [Polypedilum vanderplanki]
MEHIFCGIHFPAPRHFERVRVLCNLSENSSALKERVKNEILFGTKDEISLVYCGNILEDDEPINKYNLKAGSTVHVLRKIVEESPKEYTNKFTELDVGRTASLYRSLNSGNFHKISRPEVIKEIFSKHPELQKDIIASSFVKDPILLSNLQNPDTVRKMAENHRSLIEASPTICNALRSIKIATTSEQQNAIPIRQNFDDFSDSSSSSSGSDSPQASTSAGRRITNEFLRRSLAAITQQNQNSLANISQRNLSQDASNSNTISPSSSSSSVPGRRPIISSSMFMNAMSEVLRARRSETNVFGRESEGGDVPMHSSSSSSLLDTQEQQPTQEEERQSAEPEIERMDEDESARDAREIAMIASFQMQLKQMEDMGLTNKAANIQALMVCNGNLEAAVNLVLAEMNMS